MPYTLDQFAAECHRILAADSGLAGREQVRALLGEVCSDAAFVATYLSDHVSTRQILYEDRLAAERRVTRTGAARARLHADAWQHSGL